MSVINALKNIIKLITLKPAAQNTITKFKHVLQRSFITLIMLSKERINKKNKERKKEQGYTGESKRKNIMDIYSYGLIPSNYLLYLLSMRYKGGRVY